MYHCVDKNGQEKDIIKYNSEYSDRFTLNLYDLDIQGIKLRNKLNEHDVVCNSENVCFSRNNLIFPDLSITFDESWNVQVDRENFKEFHFKFLYSQLEKLDNLIKNSEIGFLEFALFRKVQILTILYHNSGNKQEIKNQIMTEYNVLQNNSKRMKRMYEDFKKKLQ